MPNRPRSEVYLAVCCSVLQRVAVCCNVLQCRSRSEGYLAYQSRLLQSVCCSVLQCFAVCCSVLQCVSVCCSVLQCVAVCCSVLQNVAVCCSVLQRVAVRESALCEHFSKVSSIIIWQRVAVCVAVCCSILQHTRVGTVWTFLKSLLHSHLTVCARNDCIYGAEPAKEGRTPTQRRTSFEN